MLVGGVNFACGANFSFYVFLAVFAVYSFITRARRVFLFHTESRRHREQSLECGVKVGRSRREGRIRDAIVRLQKNQRDRTVLREVPGYYVVSDDAS